MKPAPFEYVPVTTVADALAALHDQEEAKVLAGGQSLVPLMAMRLARPTRIVDVNGIADLAHVSIGDGIRIGALVRQAQLEHLDGLAVANPLVAHAIRFVGHDEIRNRGTVGGSVAHADPAAEWPALCVALDAELEIQGPAGRRTVRAADFFQGTFTTALADDELLVEIGLPRFDADGWGFEELSRRSGDFAIAGAVALLHLHDGRISRARVVLMNAGSVPVALQALDRALVGCRRSEVEPVIREHIALLDDLPADIQADREMRRRLLTVVAGRAVGRAFETRVPVTAS